ncbi:MAG TPA: tRNA (adenosine(37)-N6)-threonylcarbamoyltransferase complex ATPase subunit type 1 TsaE [Candidatus Krumholzibacteria bacterium]|nr:tRNA (adenosine(37)-N6)-threonylcarbamoyltransferase complex ATPase subunit type 1 TsaE [Candidatus Krumholzibacteria bacterium]
MSRAIAQTVRTNDAAETERFGAALGACIHRGAGVCLTGPLGAGKTVLVRGLCRGLGAVEPVTSPTFILMESFAGRLPIVHIDLYRLEHEREVEDIGVFDMLDGETVVIAEWGERSPALLEECDLEIRIEPGEGTTRTIHVHATPDFARELEGLSW